MAAPEAAPSLIFEYASATYEEEDSVEKEMALAHQQLIESFQGKSDHEIHNFLQEGASASMARHGEIINGLLYGILTNKGTATDFYRHMNFVSRDQLASAGKQIRYFCIHVHFQKFRQTVKEQLVWIVGQLTELRFQGCENLYMNLLKQIRGGDISTGNIQHAEAMLNLLNTHLPWVYNNPVLIAYSCFTYLRIILDHSRYPSLKQAEVTYCTKLLRERFRECSDIGRDLVRALQDVSRIKEFEEIWIDLLHNPENLNPQLDGIHKLMAVPSRDFILGSRLTFDMERKLLFILKTLNVGDHIRNTTWFYERYLAAPEADALFSDIIRYICGVYHPTNAVLASSIVPRWLFIATLLRYVRSHTTAANIKLALFYDWLFYDPARDSIMNIEPAMLLMERSLMREPWVTAILVEFLHFTVLNYHPTLREVIQKHVGMAMQVLVDKQVIKKIGLIYQAPILNEYQSIKEYILTLFPLQLAAEGISNIQINNTAMESLDENHLGPGAESDGSDSIEDFETGSLGRPYDNQLTGGDDEETFMSGGRSKERSRDNSRESSHEPMQVDESPVAMRPAPSSTQSNDEEEPVEDEVMESAVVESSTSAQATTGAETIIPNWNFPSPTSGSGGATSSKDGDNPVTPVPGASLWIFGSSLQDFKKAYELAPDSPETGGMFRKIWDIYSDVGGANVEGADLANEIGPEICTYAQKADVPADYLSSFSEDNQGVLDALISCLWRVMDREGEDGALRVAQMFMRSEVNVSVQDRLLGMWYLLGLIRWHMRSAGTASLTFEQVLDLYASYLRDSAAQEQARGETESGSEEDTEQTTVEMAREFLMRDLQHLQDRQLGTFDTVLPLILQYIPDLVPKNDQFLRLVLAMASPIQIYGLSMGLSRRDFILLSTPVPTTIPTSGSGDKKASNSKGKGKNTSRTENPFSTFKDILAGEWEPKVTLKLVDTLGQTLDWETFEQMGVWQLVQSELGGDAKAISRILRASWIPGMTQVANSEALSGLVNLIRALSIAPPSLKLGKALAHIAAAEDQVSNDMMHFSQSCAARWASSYPDHLAALLTHLSDKSVPQDQVSDFSMDADADVDMDDVSGNNTSKTTRSSRSKSSSPPSTSISKVKLTAKQRKQQGMLLHGFLRLLRLWWNEISEKNARQSFFRVWSTQVRNQVRDALVENFGSSNLADWPEQWWQKGDEAKKSNSAAASRRKGGRRSEKSEDDEDEEDNEDGNEDSDQDGEKTKSENEDEDDSEDEDDTKTRSKAKGGANTKNRKRPHNDDDDEEEEEEEEEEQEAGSDDEEEEASSETEKKTRQSAKDKKRFGGAADSLSSSTSSSRRNSPKAGATKSTSASSKAGVLNSRASTRNKLAAASSTTGRRASVPRRAKPDTRKRKISDDDDEEEDEQEEEEDDDEDEEEEEEGDDDEEDEEGGEEDGEEGDQDAEEDDEDDENDGEQEDLKTLKPMLYSQRRAAASANSKLMSKGNAASSNSTSSSSSSANSSANSTPNPNGKAKASANTAANKKRGKPKRRIMSEDESDE